MHKSSQIIATITGSFLLHLLRVLSNCSYIDHSVSGPISSDFLVLTSLSLARTYLLQIHYTKGTPFLFMTAPVSIISGSLSLLPCFSFHLSLSLLVLYRCSFVFSLRGLVPLSSNFALMFYSSLPLAPFYGSLSPSLFFFLCGGFSTPLVSLATTSRISLDFFSSRYLDVSVLWVFLSLGFPLRFL